MSALTWSGGRIRLAAEAVAAAVLTACAAVVIGGPEESPMLAAAFVAASIVALFYPAVISAEVVGGQLMVANLFMAGNPLAPLLLTPVIAGTVATAELLAAVARLDIPMRREPGRLGLPILAAAALGSVAFLAVALIIDLPGPTGLTAAVLACGACVVLAMRLTRVPGLGPPPVPRPNLATDKQ